MSRPQVKIRCAENTFVTLEYVKVDPKDKSEVARTHVRMTVDQNDKQIEFPLDHTRVQQFIYNLGMIAGISFEGVREWAGEAVRRSLRNFNDD